MARLSAPFTLSGTFGQLVAYQRKDIAGTLVRTPSNLTRQRFRSDPCFANSRRTATEAGGRSTAAKALRHLLHPLAAVRDHNWHAALTGTLTAVQHRDRESVYGQRSVLFSRHGSLLEGYGLSRRTPFEQLLRSPVATALSRESLEAQLTLPELIAGVNFFAPSTLPYFRLVGVLGAVPDLFYTPQGYQAEGDYRGVYPQAVYSDWYPVIGGAPATTLALQLSQPPPNRSFGLVLTVGVVMGTVNQWGRTEPVSYTGSARIVAVG